ncbi:DUF981 family protein [Deinococcota bacterium DY0809b]
MFIDYLTVMMVAVVMGAVFTAVYGYAYLDRASPDERRPWAFAFWTAGLLLVVPGLHVTLTWPLPGAYNILMGEPALFFGVVLLLTGFAIWHGLDLTPLTWTALFGGFALLALSVAILQHGLSRAPLMWALGYGALGLAAVLTPLAYRAPGWRLPVVVLLLVGAAVFALGGYGAYIDHTAKDAFGKWVPWPLR